MKRCFLAILAILYMSAATGANLHMHYCMGERTGWSLWQEDSEECGKCGMEKKTASASGCCKDEFQQAKLKLDQNSRTFSIESIDVPDPPVHNTFTPLTIQKTASECWAHVNTPSGSKVPLYLFERNFRI